MLQPPSPKRATLTLLRRLRCLVLIGLSGLPTGLRAAEDSCRVIRAELDFNAYSAARPVADGFGIIGLFCRGVDPHTAKRISVHVPTQTELRNRGVPIGSITLRGHTIEQDDETPLSHLHLSEIAQGPHGLEIYFTFDARIETDPSYSGTIDHNIPFQISY